MNSKMCRICLIELNDNEFKSLFDLDDSMQISDKIMSVTSVKIDINENLPEIICQECYSNLKISFEFKQLCERSDTKLRILYGQENDNQDIVKITFIKSECIEQIDNIKNNEIEEKIGKNEKKRSRVHWRKRKISKRGKTIAIKAEYEANEESLNECDTNQEAEKSQPKRMKKEKTIAVPVKKKDYCASIQCSTCGKVVSSKFRLKCHMRIHTGEKPFKCDQCSKTFSLAYNLKVHQRTHTGEKPLVCSNCGKTFAQSAGLVAHMRLHTGEKPYKCLMCPLAFKTCSHLQYHIRLHTGEKNFVCNVCERAFITKGDLTQHLKTHSGERTHVCSVCGLKLSRAYHLSRHMLTHTGVKNHKCEECGCAYAQKGDLVRHKMKKHPPEQLQPIQIISTTVQPMDEEKKSSNIIIIPQQYSFTINPHPITIHNEGDHQKTSNLISTGSLNLDLGISLLQTSDVVDH